MRYWLLFLALFLTSCEEDSNSAAELAELRKEIAELKESNALEVERLEREAAAAQLKATQSRKDLMAANEKMNGLIEELAKARIALREKPKQVATAPLAQTTNPTPLSKTEPPKLPPLTITPTPKPAPASTPKTDPSFDPTKAVVLMEGDHSVGTGFFVRSGSNYYLYTAAHVYSGNKKVTVKTNAGRIFKRFGKLEIATDVDVARIQMLERPPAYLELPTKQGEAALNTPITAYGNSGGGAVLTNAEGVVQAIGPESLEISAEVIEGNSGGPIVINGSRTVVGIVTHGILGKTDIWSADTRYSEVRRFAARLDRPIKWQKSTLKSFMAEPDKIDNFNRVSRLLFALAVLQPTPDGVQLGTTVNGDIDARTILQENQSMKAVQALLKLNNDIAFKNIRPDVEETRGRFINFYRGVLSAAHSQSLDMKSLSPYDKEVAKGSIDIRAKARAAMMRRLKSFGG